MSTKLTDLHRTSFMYKNAAKLNQDFLSKFNFFYPLNIRPGAIFGQEQCAFLANIKNNNNN